MNANRNNRRSTHKYRILISQPRGPQGQEPRQFYLSHDQSRRQTANRYTREEAERVVKYLREHVKTCTHLQGERAKYRPTYEIV
jgi:endonuclease I